MNPTIISLIIACVCFALAALDLGLNQTKLIAGGLFFFPLSFII